MLHGFPHSTSIISGFGWLTSPLLKCFVTPEAPGVAEFYEVLYRHWDGPLRALHERHLERAKVKGSKDVEVIPDDDDDGDMEALESKSLQQALKGIVIEGVIVIDEIGGQSSERSDGAEKCDESKVVEKVDKSEGVEKVDKSEGVEKDEKKEVKSEDEKCEAEEKSPVPNIPFPRRSPHMNIDQILNPPGLPRLGPYDLPGRPNALRAAPSVISEQCDLRLQQLQ